MNDMKTAPTPVRCDGEPVAWRITDGEGGYNLFETAPEADDVAWASRYGRQYEPLYAAPPPPSGVREALEAAKEALLSNPSCGPQKTVLADDVIYHLDGSKVGWALNKVRAALSQLPATDEAGRDAVIEECAKHLQYEADVATNSLHCGDNAQTIASTHRISRTYYEAAKAIRSLSPTQR